ncbi:flagellar basal body rod protein FlgC [Parvibium lacunae]|uniref:Flagellar basal-body rod protein FlgC n=1 Tax=Parvibium lacunae TaxID=1888893 RepID=A0A368L4X1_9BURK|nr:flagellar basal body rod protein FlgC [Parvibium lacunae]RCS58200.1 flagellar basal body rod protein FlgC [Parvibium lacunae]
MSLLQTFQIASSGMTAQSQRLNTVASNLANADSVAGPDGQPYRARQVVFQAVPVAGQQGLAEQRAQAVQVKEVTVDNTTPLRRQYDPKHPFADKEGYVTLPNVNAVEEMVNMLSASRAYQANVDVAATARTMLLKTLSLGQ